MRELSLIDEMLYVADGDSAVAGDTATERLERLLLRLQRTSPAERFRVIEQIEVLHRQADFDHARAVAREIEAGEKVREWKERVEESRGDLREEASERLAEVRAAAASVAEEAA